MIHNIRGYNQRKSARFKGIVPDNGNKVVNIIRKDSRSGSMKLLNNIKEKEVENEDD